MSTKRITMSTATSRELLWAFYPDHEEDNHSIDGAYYEPCQVTIVCSCGDRLPVEMGDAAKVGISTKRLRDRLKDLQRLWTEVRPGKVA